MRREFVWLLKFYFSNRIFMLFVGVPHATGRTEVSRLGGGGG